jgi:hypothetical protein
VSWDECGSPAAASAAAARRGNADCHTRGAFWEHEQVTAAAGERDQASAGLPGPGPAAPPGPALRASRLSGPQVLEKITSARLARDQAEAELAALTDHAVALGIGWPQIARRLGVSRQAARQQYQRRHRDDAAQTGQDHAA